MVDGFVVRYVKVVVPFVVAAAAALTNAGCSDGGEGNTGGSGGSGNASSSSGEGGGSSSSSASSSGMGGGGGAGGMMGCGDLQTDPMNCGACDNQCAPGQTCMAGVCTCGNGTAAFADVQGILTAKCATAGCHTGGPIAKAGLDLSAGNSYMEIVDTAASQCGGARTLVVPGKPDESYLMDKLLGVDMCGANSKRMPPSGALPMGDMQTISDWICAGAPQ